MKGGEIARLVRNGFYSEALTLHSHLHSLSSQFHQFTFPALLKVCAKLQLSSQGNALHAHLLKSGFLPSHLYTATALVAMYMNLRHSDAAARVFDEMPQRNLASLNAAIYGFAQNGQPGKAFWVFKQAAAGGILPNSVSVVCLLPACENVRRHGLQVHCWAVKLGVDDDVYVATSLVTMYSNCGESASGRTAFGSIPTESVNVVCYNAFISGLLQNGDSLAVFDVFKDMMESSVEKPNFVTFTSVLSACSELSWLSFGRQVHGIIVKMGMVSDITIVGNALMDMYSKCGGGNQAFQVFKELGRHRSLITWNIMIAGLMLNRQSEDAILLFEQLESEGLRPDSATWNSMINGFSRLGKGAEAFKFFILMQRSGISLSLKSITSLLPACSAECSLQCGKRIHGYVLKTDTTEDEFVATSLIDMYMKCGHSLWARRVFDLFTVKSNDPAPWNAMISGYGRNGEDECAFEIFNRMLEKKVTPNSITFKGVLSVCSQVGNVEMGCEIFRTMSRDYGLCPSLEHFSCIIDLFNRAGRLKEARELIEGIPEPSASAFASMLGACQRFMDSELGEEMTEMLLQLDPQNPVPYVIMSNIYSMRGRWEDAEKIREKMNQRGLKKFAGSSLIGLT